MKTINLVNANRFMSRLEALRCYKRIIGVKEIPPLTERYCEMLRSFESWLIAPIDKDDVSELKLLGLSARAVNALWESGVTTLVQLSSMTQGQLMCIHNLGKKSIAEIERLLKEPDIAKRLINYDS